MEQKTGARVVTMPDHPQTAREGGFNFAMESKTKKAESDSPCAIASKVECPPLTHFDD